MSPTLQMKEQGQMSKIKGEEILKFSSSENRSPKVNNKGYLFPVKYKPHFCSYRNE